MHRSESDADFSTIIVCLSSQKTAPEKKAEVRLFFRFSTSYKLVFTLQNIINETTIIGTIFNRRLFLCRRNQTEPVLWQYFLSATENGKSDNGNERMF